MALRGWRDSQDGFHVHVLVSPHMAARGRALGNGHLYKGQRLTQRYPKSGISLPTHPFFMATTNSSKPSSAQASSAAAARESCTTERDASDASVLQTIIADPNQTGHALTSDEVCCQEKARDFHESSRVLRAPVLGRPPTPVDGGRCVKDTCLDEQSRDAQIPATLLSSYRGESRLRSIAPVGVGVNWAHPNDMERLKREWYTIWLDTKYPETADPWGFSSASNSMAVTPVSRSGGTER